MGINVPFHKPHITDAEIEAVADVMRSGWLTMGPKTVEFEESFRARTGASQAVAVSSATAALHLALVASGVGEGDEVIVPAMTFAASAAPEACAIVMASTLCSSLHLATSVTA